MRRKAAFGRHHNVFAQASGNLAGTAKEFLIAAGIDPARAALIASAAGDQRVHRYGIAFPKVFDGRADFLDNGGTFMTYNVRKFHNLRTDPPGFIIMHVASADSHRPDPQKNLLGSGDFGFVHIPQFNSTDAGKQLRLHRLACLTDPGIEESIQRAIGVEPI
jgi:hypothetical protein